MTHEGVGHEGQGRRIAGNELLDRTRIGGAKSPPSALPEIQLLGADVVLRANEGGELVGIELAEAHKARIAGKGTDADEPPPAAPVAQEVQDLKQLELVVEVGFEPEQDVVSADESAIARREVGESVHEPIAARLEQEPRSNAPQLARRELGRNRALVEHVPPREEIALQPHGFHRSDDCVAVRHVERRGQPARTSFTWARPLGSVIQIT